METNSKIKKQCFFITPIGIENTEIRKKTDRLVIVLQKVLEEKGFELNVSHKESSLGSITNKIIQHILFDDLVIANLTGLNANVMYELAVRHSTFRPIISIVEVVTSNLTSIPFDIKDDRYIEYFDAFGEDKPLQAKIGDCIDKINFSAKQDNPILRAKSISLLKKLDMQDVNGDIDKIFKEILKNPIQFSYDDEISQKEWNHPLTSCIKHWGLRG